MKMPVNLGRQTALQICPLLDDVLFFFFTYLFRVHVNYLFNADKIDVVKY